MKKTWYAVIFTILCCSMWLVSCDLNSYQGTQNDLFEVGIRNLPGTPGARNDTIEVIEEDNYGRVLFRFSSDGVFFVDASQVVEDRNLKAYVICQKSTKTEAYYLENECYLVAKDWDYFTEDVLADFKNKNDWNKELVDSKLTCCKIGEPTSDMSFHLPSDEEIRSIIGKLDEDVTWTEEVTWTTDFINYDATGRALVFVRVHSNSSVQFCGSYIMISDSTGSFTIEATQKIDDFYNHKQELINLKEKVGWIPLKDVQ